MYDVGAFSCSLEARCQLDLDCRRVGSRRTLGFGLHGEVYRSSWGYLVLRSIINLNNQLYNQYSGIHGAAIRAIAEIFRVNTFYPTPDQQFSIRNTLQGIGTALSIAGGIIAPSILGTAGTGLSAAGGLLGNVISEATDLNAVQETFAPKVEDAYAQYVNALDNLTAGIFRGENFDGVNLTSIIQNGAWMFASALTPVSSLELYMKIEILSPSIDALWKTKPYNKMWVLFVNLEDDMNNTKCQSDLSGPQDLKYCADGGIYYTYNYIEERGSYQGHVGYPWGAENLTGIDIEPAVMLISIYHKTERRLR